MTHPALRALFVLPLLTLACADQGEGEIEVRAWGEDFIEIGIPAAQFSDGWAVEFSRFEVTLRSLTIAGQALADPQPIDLAQPSNGEGQLVGRTPAAPGSYDDAAFAVELMQVEGTASKGEVSKSFAWTFPLIVYYSECETTTEVAAGELAQLQITAHADHLFYDSLVAEQPALRFEALAAADADGDDVITLVELAAADLGAYDPGNIDVDNLAQFLEVLTTTIMHVDGEAHCVGATN